jgi:hypothetical protein
MCCLYSFFFKLPGFMTRRADCVLPEDVRHSIVGQTAEDGYRYRINSTKHDPTTGAYTCYLLCRNRQSQNCGGTGKVVIFSNTEGSFFFSRGHAHNHEPPTYGQRVSSPVKKMIAEQSRMGNKPGAVRYALQKVLPGMCSVREND